jgi:hypothetical protein
LQTADPPLKHSEKLDQSENKQGGCSFRQNKAENHSSATESVPNDDLLVEINAVKLLVQTLLVGQVCNFFFHFELCFLHLSFNIAILTQ